MNLKLALIGALCSPFYLMAQQDTAWRSFKHKEGLYSLSYPPTWASRTDEQKRVFFTSPQTNGADNFQENINISVAQDDDYKMLNLERDGSDIIDEIRKSFSCFTLLDNQLLTQNGTQGMQIVYTAKVESAADLDLLFTQRFFVKNSRLFTITFTSIATEKTFQSAAMRLMNSISF